MLMLVSELSLLTSKLTFKTLKHMHVIWITCRDHDAVYAPGSHSDLQRGHPRYFALSFPKCWHLNRRCLPSLVLSGRSADGHLVFSLSLSHKERSRTEEGGSRRSKNRDSFRGALKIEDERGRRRGRLACSPDSVYWITQERGQAHIMVNRVFTLILDS